MWRKENPHALMVGAYTGTATIEKRTGIFQKFQNKTTIGSNSTTEQISEENEITKMKRYMFPNVHSSIIYNRQHMKTT